MRRVSGRPNPAQEDVIEKHQLAGVDERERGFSRLVEIDRRDGAYRALLRYEATVVVTEPRDTHAAALLELVRTLHERGYQQLRSRLSFRDGAYLGSQEAWIEYPDPARPSLRTKFIEWARRLWAPHT